MAEAKSTMSTKLLIIIVLGVAFVAGYLVAREKYKPQINELSSMVIDRDDKITYLNNLRSRLVLVDGQLIQNKDGEIMIIEDNLLLSDGSRVTVGGAITRPNGEIVQLEEGESLFIDGTIVTEEELMEMDNPKE
jgi:hypothetical protein